jgi:hypothetical protein
VVVCEIRRRSSSSPASISHLKKYIKYELFLFDEMLQRTEAENLSVLLEEEIVSYFVIVIVKVESYEKKMRRKRDICIVYGQLNIYFYLFLSKNGIIIYL